MPDCDNLKRERERLEVRLQNMTDKELHSYAENKPAPTALENELRYRWAAYIQHIINPV